MTKRSELELLLSEQIKDASLPPPEIEYQFAAPTRRWRADFAWPANYLIVEIEGGTWIQGSHNRGSRYGSDCEKYNWATLHGWTVLRFTTNMVRDGQAITTISRYFDMVDHFRKQIRSRRQREKMC